MKQFASRNCENRLIYFAGPEDMGAAAKQSAEKVEKKQEAEKLVLQNMIEDPAVTKARMDKLQAAEKQNKAKEEVQLKELAQKIDAQRPPVRLDQLSTATQAVLNNRIPVAIWNRGSPEGQTVQLNGTLPTTVRDSILQSLSVVPAERLGQINMSVSVDVGYAPPQFTMSVSLGTGRGVTTYSGQGNFTSREEVTAIAAALQRVVSTFATVEGNPARSNVMSSSSSLRRLILGLSAPPAIGRGEPLSDATIGTVLQTLSALTPDQSRALDVRQESVVLGNRIRYSVVMRIGDVQVTGGREVRDRPQPVNESQAERRAREIAQREDRKTGREEAFIEAAQALVKALNTR